MSQRWSAQSEVSGEHRQEHEQTHGSDLHIDLLTDRNTPEVGQNCDEGLRLSAERWCLQRSSSWTDGLHLKHSQSERTTKSRSTGFINMRIFVHNGLKMGDLSWWRQKCFVPLMWKHLSGEIHILERNREVQEFHKDLPSMAPPLSESAVRKILPSFSGNPSTKWLTIFCVFLSSLCSVVCFQMCVQL